MILTIDLGSSFTKVSLWTTEGLAGSGRAPLVTVRPQAGWAEQDAASWWASVVAASASARADAGLSGAAGDVEVVACCGARQTFVAVDAGGAPRGPGILWSDRRGAEEVAPLLERVAGAADVRARTGAPLGAESVAAKLAWLSRHHPDRLNGARFVLTPRDLVVARLCGRYCTDRTMASRSGLFDLDGSVVAELAGPAVGLLPPVLASDAVAGEVLAAPADELGVPAGIPVVIGAGDRACEVIGSGAAPNTPMVSWGTTASVVVPIDRRPERVPVGLVLSRAAAPVNGPGAEAGWLIEGGLSSAGAFLDWLAALTDRSSSVLIAEAADRPPGARGLVAVPWLGGARAPWWRDAARAGFVGASLDHDAGDFARAAVESVAADVRRCLVAAAQLGDEGATDAGPTAVEGSNDHSTGDRLPFNRLALGGRGSIDTLWPAVLAAVCGLPAAARRSGEAASAGAAWLAARAIGQPMALDDYDPEASVIDPGDEDMAAYERWRARSDGVAEVLSALELAPEVAEDRPSKQGGG